MKEPILYYSTNLNAEKVTFKDALLKGLAPDRGLYMPEIIPQISLAEIDEFSNLSYPDIAYKVMGKFLDTELPDSIFYELVKDAYNFDVPLENVVDKKFIMRLDRGPTASFKDFAARMMGRLINYYLGIENRQLIILTATSGDTGSAIANAFYGLNNIKVVVLYPETEVTSRQRKQMTTLGENIQVIAIDGKFDDCQALVKQAFSDHELEFLNLSSANSINIGRLLPQMVYYFYAFAKLRSGKQNDNIFFSVPSGNFGDMMGGMFAMKMGLPVKRFIIATNANDEFPIMLHSGVYNKIDPSLNCISSAMNVGHPSNLSRLLALYGGVMDEKGHISQKPDFLKMRNEIHAVSVTDMHTRNIIRETFINYNVLLEPHGAVGWAGLLDYLQLHPSDDTPDNVFVSLETAHPAKFPDEIKDILGIDPELPESLRGIEHKQEFIIKLPNTYPAFKEFLKKSF